MSDWSETEKLMGQEGLSSSLLPTPFQKEETDSLESLQAPEWVARKMGKGNKVKICNTVYLTMLLFIVRYLTCMYVDADTFDVYIFNHTQILVTILNGIWSVRDEMC